MFCKYKDIFGKVGEGVHSYRLFNIAIVDVVMTIIVSYIIHIYNRKYNFWCILLIIFLMGILMHRLFCVRTTVDKILFN